jgi:hypothetical protein
VVRRDGAGLVISGSMGSGKTSVLGEASDLLTARDVAHASIDLDAIGTAGVPDDVSRRVTLDSLAAIDTTVRDAGLDRLLIAEAVDSRATVERLRLAMPESQIVVCRLTAAIPTMQARLRVREPGMLQARFVAHAAELEGVLDSFALEDFRVSNQDRSITDVARGNARSRRVAAAGVNAASVTLLARRPRLSAQGAPARTRRQRETAGRRRRRSAGRVERRRKGDP